MAKGLGIPVVGTLDILLSLVRRESLRPEDADSMLRVMVESGYRSPIESASELLSPGESLADQTGISIRRVLHASLNFGGVEIGEYVHLYRLAFPVDPRYTLTE